MADDDSKKLILLPALNALVQPTAETLGHELNEIVIEWLEQRRKRTNARNIESHLQGVRSRLKHAPHLLESPDVRHLEFFAEWVDGVQDINSSDEIAQLWQGLLAKALSEQEDEQELLLESLKKLEPSEAAFFVSTFGNDDSVVMYLNQRSQFFISHLQVLHLVQGPEPIPWAKVWLSLIVVIPIFIWFMDWLDSLLPFRPPIWVVLILFALAIYLLYDFSKERRTYRLTDLGMKLISLGRRND